MQQLHAAHSANKSFQVTPLDDIIVGFAVVSCAAILSLIVPKK